jgi:hypothetical protein
MHCCQLLVLSVQQLVVACLQVRGVLLLVLPSMHHV